MFSFLSLLSLNKSKLVIYIIAILGLIIALFSTYYKGYNNGVENEKNRLAKEYSELLEKKIIENSIRVKKEYEEILKNKEVKIKKEYIYIEKEKESTNIIENSKILNDKSCVIQKEEIELFNKLTRKTK